MLKCSPLYSHIKLSSLMMAHHSPQRFEQTLIYTTGWCMYINIINHGSTDLEKICKDIFYISLCKSSISNCGRIHISLELLIWTNSNRHSLKTLLHMFCLFVPLVLEKSFLYQYHHISLFSNYTPLRVGWNFSWKFLHPLYLRMLCGKFNWN